MQGQDEFMMFIQNELFLQKIVEYRCGAGRMAWLFNPLNYVGVDIDGDVLAEARKANPAHRFEGAYRWETISGGDVAFVYDAFERIDGIDLVEEARVFTQPRVLVSEFASKFPLAEYSRAFALNGYGLRRIATHDLDGREIVSMEFLKE
jgi:SAM-dependent methyltransferase